MITIIAFTGINVPVFASDEPGTATASVTASELTSDDIDRIINEYVQNLINDIPALSKLGIKAEDLAKIASDAYDSLPQSQKDMISDPEFLESAASVITQFKSISVTDLINALPESVTADNSSTIEKIRKAYDSMSGDQKKLIDNSLIDRLIEAEKKVSGKIDAVKDVNSKITKLPSVIKLDNEAAVKDARKAYDALSPAQKKLIKSANLTKLEKAETSISQWKEYKSAADAAAKAATKIISAKAKKGGKAVISWKQNSDADGYDIRWSTDKKFKKAVKKAKTNSSAAVKKTIKIKSGKKNYVRVRTFKRIANAATGETKTTYGKWSKIKTVKAK